MLMILLPEPAHREPPPHGVSWPALQASYQAPAGEPFVFPLPTLTHTPEGMPIDVTLEASGDKPNWLQLDRERLSIGGTAPLVAEERIIGQPDRSPVTLQLPHHWTW
jgi:hypothetical protein